MHTNNADQEQPRPTLLHTYAPSPDVRVEFEAIAGRVREMSGPTQWRFWLILREKLVTPERIVQRHTNLFSIYADEERNTTFSTLLTGAQNEIQHRIQDLAQESLQQNGTVDLKLAAIITKESDALVEFTQRMRWGFADLVRLNNGDSRLTLKEPETEAAQKYPACAIPQALDPLPAAMPLQEHES